MQLFRILFYLLQIAYFIILTNSNQITIKNYDIGFNKTYYGNVSILCKNAGACNMTTIYCDTGDCYIEAAGNNKGQLNNLIIDARNIQKGYKFEIKCGSTYQSSITSTNCKNVKVLCPFQRGATCKCSNCNYHHVKLYCELGIGVYCTGGRVVPSWNQNNIWCDGGPLSSYYGGYGGGNGKFICDRVDWEMFSCESTYTNPARASSYYYAPNNKCVAFETTYYNTYYKEYLTFITTYSCRETINATAKEYKFHLPICVKYISKPDYIPELKQYFNITRIIIKNKTRIINKTNWIDKERINWINKTNIINKTNWINKTNIIEKINWINKVIINWINKTNIIEKINWIDKIIITIINKTNWINQTRWTNKTKWINKTRWINETNKINVYKENIINKFNENNTLMNTNHSKTFEWNTTSIAVIGGLSLFGLLFFCLTFYIAWKCWLRDHIEDMIIDYCLCGYGEYIMTCLEIMGCVSEGWEERREEKILQPYLVGLSKKEKQIVRGQVQKNKARLDAATKLEWEDLCEKAVRPRDAYHKNLIEGSIYKKNDREKEIELQEVQENIKLEIKPATPRRRIVRTMEI